MERNIFYTIPAWLSEYNFIDDVVLPDVIADNVFLDKLEYEEEGDETRLACTILLGKSFEVGLPNINDFGFLVGNDEETFTARLNFGLTPDFLIRVNEVSAKLMIGTALLIPARLVGPNKYEPDTSLSRQLIEIGTLSLAITAAGRISFDFENDVSIPPSYLGSSGVIIELKHLSVPDLDVNNLSISIGEARVILPDFFIIPDGTALTLSDATINNRGFSGNCSIDIPLDYDDAQKKFFAGGNESSIFGIPGGIKHLEVVVENNQPTTFLLEGQLLVPYFDAAIDVLFNITNEGCVSFVLKGINGEPVTITKDELLSIYIYSLELNCEGRYLSISGGLEPILFAAEGMKWPRMDVKNLKIKQNGEISIDEAWLDLKDMASLDLFGFHMELRKIGIGTLVEGQPKLWLDLSGGIKLIEQIPIGIDVEGFRIIWPQDISTLTTPAALSQAIGIRFNGVQFSFGVPGALQIDGLIRFFKDAQATGFAGDMVLVIPAAGITAEAGLLVGMNTEPDPFVFFYVYFGLECAAGIPLGQSGLALKGALGLFGINVAPDKTAEQNWYYDWYKRAPAPGAHQTTKWTYSRDSLAIGAGVTITTVDGVVKGTKGIIVLALPGPILVINGKALVLNGLNPDPAAEPPFSATAVFDGKEKIVQFNIEAQAEIVEDMIDAHAGVEAFFDFKDVTNWHLYLGQDEPEDRRIRANILNIIEADAYLMLDMLDADSPRARMGVSVSVRPKIDSVEIDIPFTDDDPKITFMARLDLGGRGEVSIQPEQFSGEAYIDVGIEVRALGFELEVSAEANLAVEGPAPFSLQATLDLDANLPDPLPDYHSEFDYKLEIPKLVLDIKDPLATVSLFSRFISESKSTPLYATLLTDSQLDDKDGQTGLHIVPFVDCDVNPILSFEHEMNQDCNFIIHPGNIKSYQTGILSFTPMLKKVMIEEKKKSGGGWSVVYSTENNSLAGVWLAESDPGSPAAPASRRLQLLTTNALANTTHSTGMQGYAFMQSEAESAHLSTLIIRDHPNLFVCPVEPIKPTCVEFRHEKKIEGRSIKWSGIEFLHKDSNILIGGNYLDSDSGLQIIFPKRIIELKIEFVVDPGKLTIGTFTRPRGSMIHEVIGKAKSKNQKPEFGCSLSVNHSSTITTNAITITSAGFDCVNIASKTSGLKIKKICYKTLDSQYNQKNKEAACVTNEKLLDPTPPGGNPPGLVRANNLFNPGCYYRITVQTQVTGEIINNNDKDNAIITLYTAMLSEIAGDISTPFTRYVYFQTASPPENISAYIKWSIPRHQDKNIYRNDPCLIRFKREYIKALYGNDELADFKMQVFLKDTQGQLIRGNLAWLSGDSYTYFPDEATWKNHLTSAGFSTANKKDDILRVDFSASSLYKINSRYEMIITGARDDTGTTANAEQKRLLRFDNRYYKILHSQTFQTSRFASADMLIKNETAGCKASIIKGNSVPFETLLTTNLRDWAEAEMSYHLTWVDYDYGMAKHSIVSAVLVSKEAVEAERVLLSKAKEVVDNAYRQKALAIQQDVFFNKNEKLSEIYLIETGEASNAKIEYVWINLPESINVKKSVNTTRTIGQVHIDLVHRSSGTSFVSNHIFNTDTSQVILKLNSRMSAQSLVANYRIRLSVEIDPADDMRAMIFGTTTNSHHRYDRPAQKGRVVAIPDINILL
jgi:hypothetical protein